MTNAIFYSLFFSLFLNISIGSLKYSQIHRTFMSVYKGMFEACLISVDSSGEPIVPYYNMTEMNAFVNNYLKTNLSKYTTNYTVNVRYLRPTGTTICRNECRRVRIRLVAEINSFYSYDKTQIFKVVDGEELWINVY